jgi:hypothetical protein
MELAILVNKKLFWQEIECEERSEIQFFNFIDNLSSEKGI